MNCGTNDPWAELLFQVWRRRRVGGGFEGPAKVCLSGILGRKCCGHKYGLTCARIRLIHKGEALTNTHLDGFGNSICVFGSVYSVCLHNPFAL